ncbi:MAG: nucleoside/nucleotide kinase family protein [Microcella sp.]|uniref:nucleoside/nucleotide kinase family protein n=1 Tax=Microcella sp. TaxID=1913979 RepID=UPI0024C5A180|nr:nucleoside/nucleotide kinase family protein [Microcella sp.]UYN82938.1 MAG: nucleoside/nucleotide kinase family protein [Microcella sp.]
MTPRALSELADLVLVVEGMRAARPRASGRLIVGLVGAPGAGKSTIAAALSAELPDSVVLPMDGFHLPQAELVRLGRRDRMGAPDTFDVDAFVALLTDLRSGAGSGRRMLAPGFDRRVEEPVPGAIELLPERATVVVEGNYLLLPRDGWQRVSPLLDLSVGIVLDDDTRHERLIARHIAFGKAPDAARAWALGPDERNAAAIAATLDRADYLLEG